MPHLLALLAVLIAGLSALAADDLKKYEVWVTGDVFIKDDVLLFRAEKAVQGNTTGNIVLLGATKQTMNVLVPLYIKAAEKGMKLRLYGLFVPASDAKSKEPPGSPSVQFITWKMHLPSDPDELPARDKIIIGPEDKEPGYKVEVKSKR